MTPTYSSRRRPPHPRLSSKREKKKRKYNLLSNIQGCHCDPNMSKRGQEWITARDALLFGVTVRFAPMCIQLIPLISLGNHVWERGNLWSVYTNYKFSYFKMADIENWLISIQTIPRKLNGRKLKPSLNISQEISGPDSLPTVGIFGTFAWSASESVSEEL